MLLLLVLAAACALLYYYCRRRARSRQRPTAASRPHMNGTAGSGSSGGAASGDQVEMEVLTPMLTHVPPAGEQQLDTKVSEGLVGVVES